MLAGGDGGLVNHFADDGGYVTVNAAHSEFYGGMIGGYKLSCCFTNCLMDRMGGGQFGGYTGNAYTITNCTWHGGWLTLAPTNTAIPIVVGDSAFDGTLLSASGYGTNTSYANYNYNAFTSSTNGFPVGGASNVVVTGGFNWQSSWFGNYYLPSGSPLCLRGDVTADKVGLYHFTTQLSEVPEGTNRVSIGYHYVATDDNGNPLDSNADGIPDYLQDANGNGLVDQGDLGSWLPVVTDTHGWIGLSVFTPLQ